MKESEQVVDLSTEDLHTTMKEPGISPHQLELKIDYVCSLMRNLLIDKALVKNSRIIIRTLRKNSIEVELIHRSKNQLRVQTKIRPLHCHSAAVPTTTSIRNNFQQLPKLDAGSSSA